MTMALVSPSPEQLPEWQERLQAFEHGFTYPLGSDHFRIDHGADYFAFFGRLGAPVPVFATHDERLVGVLVAVQRTIDGRKHWYLCDLKVDPGHGNRMLALRLLERWAQEHLRDGEPIYGVSMNDKSDRNRLVQTLGRRLRHAPVQGEPLVLFSMDFDQWTEHAGAIEDTLGPVTWFDPHGVKDIVLQSTGAAMPLLHAQHGPLGLGNGAQARPGSTHMFCLPLANALVDKLAARGVPPSATATILHRNCAGMDWSHLLTSDI